jgi:membrane-bound metal-dependent hydrolase YbcI (DUF457 family)
MFLGHFGVALAAKNAAPTASLGTLFLAAQFTDLLWPVLLLTGTERVTINSTASGGLPLTFDYYPFSHSLLMVLLWAVLLGLAYWQLAGKNRQAAMVVAACVLSHWLLDFVVHVPDLPLDISSSQKAGLALWNHKTLALLAEIALFALGVWMYTTSTKPGAGRSSFGLWALVFVLLVIQLSNVYGPPPPSVQAVAMAGLLQWLFVWWAYYVDKRRKVVEVAVEAV